MCIDCRVVNNKTIKYRFNLGQRVLCYDKGFWSLFTLFKAIAVCFVFRSQIFKVYIWAKEVECKACKMGGVFTSIHFLAKYKSGKANVVADALLGRHFLLSVVKAKVLGFDWIKELYEAHEDFKEVYVACKDGVHGFHVQVEGNKFCIRKSPIRELLIKEAHGGGMAGHIRIQKTWEILQGHFHWP